MTNKIQGMDFNNLKSVHIIGVCGTLMGAFASFLKRRGISVTGSDQNIYPPMSDVLKNAGVKLFEGYSAGNLKNLGYKPDLVVIGNVIPATNEEAREAIDKGYKYTSLPEALEFLVLNRTKNLVVAGTHGKTTTSSMLSFVLSECAQKPSYFIGGVTHDLPYSFNIEGGIESGGPKYFVLEGDEYDTAFWDKVPKFNHYCPDHVILTSIEFDHADIYRDLRHVEEAFDGLIARIRDGGHLILNVDYPSNLKLHKFVLEKFPAIKVTTYSKKALDSKVGSSLGHYYPTKIETRNGITFFSVNEGSFERTRLSIRLPGEHNVLNALSVWIECQKLGISNDQITKALSKFQGVKRRQEERGEVNQVLVIDDFAHHPTAVRETLKALRMKYPSRRLVAIFEPRSATSRRKIFQHEYAEAFTSAQNVFIAKPYDQSKISRDDQFSSEDLVRDLNKKDVKTTLFEDIDQGVEWVAASAKAGDLIAVLSNGGFGGFISKLLERLKTVGGGSTSKKPDAAA